MAATTADAIVDRLRSVCSKPPFEFTEAVAWHTFDLQPSGNADQVFRVHPPSSQSVQGGFGYAEDRTDTVQIWVARKHNQQYAAVRKTLLRDMHSLTAAVVRDAHVQSGDYGIPDEGRGHTVSPDIAGREYVTLRLTLPINYDAQL